MVSRRASAYKPPCVRHGPLGLHGRLAHVVFLGVRQLQVVRHVPRVAEATLVQMERSNAPSAQRSATFSTEPRAIDMNILSNELYMTTTIPCETHAGRDHDVDSDGDDDSERR